MIVVNLDLKVKDEAQFSKGQPSEGLNGVDTIVGMCLRICKHHFGWQCCFSVMRFDSYISELNNRLTNLLCLINMIYPHSLPDLTIPTAT